MHTEYTHHDPAQLVALLQKLVWLNRESERGFETAAEHVQNRAMKILLKAYASQRAQFVQRLETEILKLGAYPAAVPGNTVRLRSYLASLHRGWIDLKAAMTIGRTGTERVVLGEGQRAEAGIAVRDYRNALTMPLPGSLRTLIREQLTQIELVHEQLADMRGDGTERLLVQLYDHPVDAQRAATQLTQFGIEATQINSRPVAEVMELYHCHCERSRLTESASAGALVGLLIGVLLGLIMAVGAWLNGAAADGLWVLGLISSMVGLLSGAGFGALISQATIEEDLYTYDQSIAHGSTLIMVRVNSGIAEPVMDLLRTERLNGVEMNALAA